MRQTMELSQFYEFLASKVPTHVSNHCFLASNRVISATVTLAQTLSPTFFSSLDWIDQLDDKGIIAGGMEDGAITLWSASKILESDTQ
jgi:hypothetical protein